MIFLYAKVYVRKDVPIFLFNADVSILLEKKQIQLVLTLYKTLVTLYVK